MAGRTKDIRLPVNSALAVILKSGAVDIFRLNSGGRIPHLNNNFAFGDRQ